MITNDRLELINDERLDNLTILYNDCSGEHGCSNCKALKRCRGYWDDIVATEGSPVTERGMVMAEIKLKEFKEVK
uniref:Uncharacterized protein n=1 Tax=viral metagenome TaxID=1070528 RepID=A0A6M3LR54_9ZZZZ